MYNNEKTYVVINTQVEGMHFWRDEDVDPPLGYEYLRSPHRHVFHIRVKLSVSGSRTVEIIHLKHSVMRWFAKWLSENNCSCEEHAMAIAKEFVSYGDGQEIEVEVLEDGENGAIVCLKI